MRRGVCLERETNKRLVSLFFVNLFGFFCDYKREKRGSIGEKRWLAV